MEQDYLPTLSRIARQAGAMILDLYQSPDLEVTEKPDTSPLTRADLAAHGCIINGLARVAPNIPVLSEESAIPSFTERRQWQQYFLVDPLDGTKEFIQRNGEFTVNIALIDQGVPIQGVVYVPAKDELYAGNQLTSVAYVERSGKRNDIRVRNAPSKNARNEPLRVLASRRHTGAALENCLVALQTQFQSIETISMGSSLKFCLLAEGKGDIYPRLSLTSEWDTAGAQAILEAAGGRVLDTHFEPLRYNTKEALLNPFFYALGDPNFDWKALLKQADIGPS